MNSLGWLGTFWQDLRYGVRVLAKSPGFTTLAVLTLALGIGASTAIFSVINAIFLRPLSFEAPDRLVAVWMAVPHLLGDEKIPVSHPDFLDWRAQNQVFEEMALFALDEVILSAGDQPERDTAFRVSAGYFPVLGVHPLLGRIFVREECAPGGNPVVILSYSLWQRKFAARRDVVGETITLDGAPHTVVGVMPADFRFAYRSFFTKNMQTEPRLWRPLNFIDTERGNHNYGAIARLKPGVTLAGAQTNMDVIARRLRQQFPETSPGMEVRVVDLRESLYGHLRDPLLPLLPAVGVVLLIACVNVANLLLVRAIGRQKEIAIRSALGAGRLRVVRQLLAESLLLAALGAALGLLLALAGCDAINALLADTIIGNAIPRIRIDPAVLEFTILLSVLTGAIFGLAPALQASKVNLNESLKEGGRSSHVGPRRHYLSRGLVIGEVALSLVLLIGTGLLIKSFLRLWRVDPGFRADKLLTAAVSLSGPQYADSRQTVLFYKRLLSRVATLPGVQAAGLTDNLPTQGARKWGFLVEGRPMLDPEKIPDENTLMVSSQYFDTLGIPLQRGRFFTEQDGQDSPPVVVVSESLARKYWGDEDALGKRINFMGPRPEWRTIVGIVGDVRQNSLAVPPAPQIYLPYFQYPSGNVKLAVRTTTDPLALAAALRKQVQALDPGQPMTEVQTMEKVVALSLVDKHHMISLMGVFGAVALILAVVGIYGVVSYSVSQRTHEMGIRIALGAQRVDALRFVLAEGLVLILIGVGLGLVAAFGVTRFLSNQLFGVTAIDPATYAAVSLLLTTVALLACYLPARRATKVDPLVALRYE